MSRISAERPLIVLALAILDRATISSPDAPDPCVGLGMLASEAVIAGYSIATIDIY